MKFVFSKTDLEVMLGGIDEVDLENFRKTGENPVAGGENKWSFDTFTNWEMFWPGFPVLVYFKVRIPQASIVAGMSDNRDCYCDVIGIAGDTDKA
mgnify:CR=1 FL=1